MLQLFDCHIYDQHTRRNCELWSVNIICIYYVLAGKKAVEEGQQHK